MIGPTLGVLMLAMGLVMLAAGAQSIWRGRAGWRFDALSLAGGGFAVASGLWVLL